MLFSIVKSVLYLKSFFFQQGMQWKVFNAIFTTPHKLLANQQPSLWERDHVALFRYGIDIFSYFCRFILQKSMFCLNVGLVDGCVSWVVLVSPLIVFMEDLSTSQDSIAKSYNFSQLKPRNPLMQPDLLCWRLNFFSRLL